MNIYTFDVVTGAQIMASGKFFPVAFVWFNNMDIYAEIESSCQNSQFIVPQHSCNYCRVQPWFDLVCQFPHKKNWRIFQKHSNSELGLTLHYNYWVSQLILTQNRILPVGFFFFVFILFIWNTLMVFLAFLSLLLYYLP